MAIDPHHRLLWEALQLIRAAIEDCAPPGAVARDEYLEPDYRGRGPWCAASMRSPSGRRRDDRPDPAMSVVLWRSVLRRVFPAASAFLTGCTSIYYPPEGWTQGYSKTSTPQAIEAARKIAQEQFRPDLFACVMQNDPEHLPEMDNGGAYRMSAGSSLPKSSAGTLAWSVRGGSLIRDDCHQAVGAALERLHTQAPESCRCICGSARDNRRRLRAGFVLN